LNLFLLFNGLERKDSKFYNDKVYCKLISNKSFNEKLETIHVKEKHYKLNNVIWRIEKH
jgi:hypothetical protein